jgi:signal transduction histidine kinase
MWPFGYLPQREAAGAAREPSAGPAMTTLGTVTARTAYLIRCIALAYIAVQVLIWHSFYAAAPWRLAGPLAAVAWGAAIVAYLLRRRPRWPLVCADSGVQVALALSAALWVPAAMRGDSANWVFILMAGQLVIPAWFTPLAVLAPLALASAAAYWAGAVLIAAAGQGNSSPVAAAAMLLAVAAAAWFGRWTLCRWATSADAALAQADSESREQYVVLSRNIERREHERLLHDTVLNTLTALARAPGRTAGVVGRCRHDVTLMEYLLSAPGAAPAAAGRPYGGLLAAIEGVASEMRARGLDVHVRVTGGGPAGDGVRRQASAPPPAGAPVPVPVAVAMAHAVREALANVASHAGTGEAWVEIALPESGGEDGPGGQAGPGGPGGQGGLLVTVWDNGRGFDPAGIDPARLGLRRSIAERIADWGGQASVQSEPGQGTVVSLCWPAPGEPDQQAVAVGDGGLSLPW